MKIYVNQNTLRSGDGSRENPFQTISEAAKIARPGDEVIVAPGIYREYVDPANAGTPQQPIVYRSEQHLGAVITGAEEVSNWEYCKDGVWKCTISNGIFGNYNPYTTLVEGDWFIASFIAHTGEVYLNDRLREPGLRKICFMIIRFHLITSCVKKPLMGSERIFSSRSHMARP